MLLDVINVKPLGDYKILVTFENNEIREFDVKPLLDRPRWQELRDKNLFNTVKVWEGTVQWIHKQDICPEWLYENSVPVDIDKQQLAIKHYKDNKISLGKCAELAEMTKEDFIKLLGQNGISIFRFDSDEELLEDIKNAYKEDEEIFKRVISENAEALEELAK